MQMILKYPGSKWKISPWIVRHIPPHHTYVEPFFGSGAIFFSKESSNIETINDMDDNVCNLFSAVRKNPRELASAIALTPYARREYDMAFESANNEVDEIEKARRFLVKCWQGHGFRTNAYKVGWKNDVQGRESMYAVRSWCHLPDRIMDTVDRLKRVQIKNRPALEVVKRFSYANAFIYADPPYLLNTRTAKQYRYEMTEQDHVDLLKTLLQFPGKVLISGYKSDLYDTMLKHWHKDSIAGYAEYQGASREEVIWMNYDYQAHKQLSLF